MSSPSGLIPTASDCHSVSHPRWSAHLIGIGGAGMQSLANVFLAAGWSVSGSDMAAEQHCAALRDAGAHVFAGHAAAHIPATTKVVIYSDAIGADNVERQAAMSRRIPQLSYPQMLGRLVAGRTGLAIAGTHGKSTTAAMTESILVEAGLDPTVVYGAVPCNRPLGGRLGRSNIAMVEACEYRSNFLHIAPRAAVVTGIEHDHFDCYPSFEALRDAFGRFIEGLPGDGVLVISAHCRTSLELACRAGCPVVTFGWQPPAQWWAQRRWSVGHRSFFRLMCHDLHVADVALRVPGTHNVANALAAAALAAQLDVDARALADGLAAFTGLQRRLEPAGWWHGLRWWDDYAHHPTEIRATLAAMRLAEPGRRIHCVFQPHQASRTAHLLDELAESLHNADRVAVAEVFAARESLDQSHTRLAAELAQRLRGSGVEIAPTHHLPEIAAWLRCGAEPGDVCLTLGAGDLRKVWDGFIYGFRTLRAAG